MPLNFDHEQIEECPLKYYLEKDDIIHWHFPEQMFRIKVIKLYRSMHGQEANPMGVHHDPKSYLSNFIICKIMYNL